MIQSKQTVYTKKVHCEKMDNSKSHKTFPNIVNGFCKNIDELIIKGSSDKYSCLSRISNLPSLFNGLLESQSKLLVKGKFYFICYL